MEDMTTGDFSMRKRGRVVLLTGLESVTWFVILFHLTRPVLGADCHLRGGL